MMCNLNCFVHLNIEICFIGSLLFRNPLPEKYFLKHLQISGEDLRSAPLLVSLCFQDIKKSIENTNYYII